MKYLLKKCGHQELGSMNASSMQPQRGQYLLMAMQDAVLSFFPALSTTRQNDFCLVPLHPLYSNEIVYCRFVYHNDRFNGSTAAHPRNEYRLYLNLEVQGGQRRFFEEGIVVLRMVNENDYESGLYLDYSSPEDGKYSKYNQILNENNTGRLGNYAVYDGVIEEFEKLVCENIISPQVVSVPEEEIHFLEERSDNLETLFTDRMFRDFVSVAYKHKCAITGMVIGNDAFNNLETAHIRPKAHRGPFLPCNGLMLCRDFHWAFDHGFLALTDDLKVMVSKNAPSSMLVPYDGKKIYIPEEPFFRPKLEYVQYHREHIFEHFESIRSRN